MKLAENVVNAKKNKKIRIYVLFREGDPRVINCLPMVLCLYNMSRLM